MSKQKISSILLIITVFGWGLSLALIFPEHLSALMALAIIFPMIPAAVLIWIQSSMVPKNILKQINALAIKIDRDLEKERTQIDIAHIPKEVAPLINAINRLLNHQNDRYMQERDFTAHASHELRTPLAGIRLQTELAMLAEQPEKRNKALRNILSSIDRGTRLVEQLLTISRLTAENVDLHTENVDLVQLAKQLIEENQLTAQQKDIQLVLKNPLAQLIIEGSEQSLMIMLDNILRNAIHYSPQNSVVTLALASDAQQTEAYIKVIDQGPGIPAQLRKTVLQRFKKAENTSHTGTGLGLSIVNRIVELHHGRLVLSDADTNSSENSTGLTVFVTLPKNHIF